jgi:hypothetical protein
MMVWPGAMVLCSETQLARGRVSYYLGRLRFIVRDKPAVQRGIASPACSKLGLPYQAANMPVMLFAAQDDLHAVLRTAVVVCWLMENKAPQRGPKAIAPTWRFQHLNVVTSLLFCT